VTPLDPRRYLLDEDESERVFRERIAPKLLASGVGVDRPVVVFVAGQPGAGKTKTTEAVLAGFGSRGGAVVVNSDYFKPFHPRYHRLLEEDDRTAAAYTSLDGRRWMVRAEEYLRARRVNTVVETTMRVPGDFVGPAAVFRAAGYQAHVAVLAVPAALSRLGIVARYQQQVQASGRGRLTDRANHDDCYTGVLQTAVRIDAECLVDVVAVYRRGNQLLYGNTVTVEGTWARPPAAAAVVAAERTRPWSVAEARDFLADLHRLEEEMSPDWREELVEIAGLARPHLPPGTASAPREGRGAPPPRPPPEFPPTAAREGRGPVPGR
jgi:UDP-N-acetylglucosamine kinase